MVHLGAMLAAGRDQFARVVASCAADDHDHVAALGEFNGGILALLRRLAHGVHEAHVGPWKALADA